MKRDKATTRNGPVVMKIEGGATVEHAQSIADNLARLLESGDAILVDLDRVERVDLTLLQLLWAAHRSAEQRGTEFNLKGPLPEPIANELVRAGFFRSPDLIPDDSEGTIWSSPWGEQ